MTNINTLIRTRKSVYPKQYIDKPIPREIIEELLENANHAPTHKLTEPWRFKVFTGSAKSDLGEFLARKYQENELNFSESKFEKIKKNTQQSGAVIAIILHRDKQERVPEWEEVAAVACAVQNIWLSCAHHRLGGYWSSPGLKRHLGEYVKLEDNESCLGFFYLGYCDQNGQGLKKKAIEEKVVWFE